MNHERLMQIILAPVVSEKCTMISEKRQQVSFRVVSDAKKAEIKAAVELLFGVKIKGVTVVNVKSKVKRVGRVIGRRSGWKKAYVSLVEGHEVDINSVAIG